MRNLDELVDDLNELAGGCVPTELIQEVTQRLRMMDGLLRGLEKNGVGVTWATLPPKLPPVTIEFSSDADTGPGVGECVHGKPFYESCEGCSREGLL